MALNKKKGSFIPSNPHAATAQIAGKAGGPSVRVILLDGSVVTISLVDKKMLGQSVFDQVLRKLDLLERDYFGLLYEDDQKHRQWLDLLKPIKKQLKKQPYIMFFRVKFYAEDPLSLHRNSKEQFYLQLKEDISAGRLPFPSDTAHSVLSYILQADVGDHINDHRDLQYLEDKGLLICGKDKSVETAIIKLHKLHKGKEPGVAVEKFLWKTRELESYGAKFNSVKHEGVPHTMGMSPAGITIYQDRRRMAHFLWRKVLQVSYKQKRFSLRIKTKTSESGEKTVVYDVESTKLCKEMWQDCVERVSFYNDHPTRRKDIPKSDDGSTRSRSPSPPIMREYATINEATPQLEAARQQSLHPSPAHNVQQEHKPQPHNVQQEHKPQPHNVQQEHKPQPHNVQQEHKPQPHNVQQEHKPQPHNEQQRGGEYVGEGSNVVDEANPEGDERREMEGDTSGNREGDERREMDGDTSGNREHSGYARQHSQGSQDSGVREGSEDREIGEGREDDPLRKRPRTNNKVHSLPRRLPTGDPMLHHMMQFQNLERPSSRGTLLSEPDSPVEVTSPIVSTCDETSESPELETMRHRSPFSGEQEQSFEEDARSHSLFPQPYAIPQLRPERLDPERENEQAVNQEMPRGGRIEEGRTMEGRDRSTESTDREWRNEFIREYNRQDHSGSTTGERDDAVDSMHDSLEELADLLGEEEEEMEHTRQREEELTESDKSADEMRTIHPSATPESHNMHAARQVSAELSERTTGTPSPQAVQDDQEKQRRQKQLQKQILLQRQQMKEQKLQEYLEKQKQQQKQQQKRSDFSAATRQDLENSTERVHAHEHRSRQYREEHLHHDQVNSSRQSNTPPIHIQSSARQHSPRHHSDDPSHQSVPSPGQHRSGAGAERSTRERKKEERDIVRSWAKEQRLKSRKHPQTSAEPDAGTRPPQHAQRSPHHADMPAGNRPMPATGSIDMRKSPRKREEQLNPAQPGTPTHSASGSGSSTSMGSVPRASPRLASKNQDPLFDEHIYNTLAPLQAMSGQRDTTVSERGRSFENLPTSPAPPPYKSPSPTHQVQPYKSASPAHQASPGFNHRHLQYQESPRDSPTNARRGGEFRGVGSYQTQSLTRRRSLSSHSNSAASTPPTPRSGTVGSRSTLTHSPRSFNSGGRSPRHTHSFSASPAYSSGGNSGSPHTPTRAQSYRSGQYSPAKQSPSLVARRDREHENVRHTADIISSVAASIAKTSQSAEAHPTEREQSRRQSDDQLSDIIDIDPANLQKEDIEIAPHNFLKAESPAYNKLDDEDEKATVTTVAPLSLSREPPAQRGTSYNLEFALQEVMASDNLPPPPTHLLEISEQLEDIDYEDLQEQPTRSKTVPSRAELEQQRNQQHRKREINPEMIAKSLSVPRTSSNPNFYPPHIAKFMSRVRNNSDLDDPTQTESEEENPNSTGPRPLDAEAATGDDVFAAQVSAQQQQQGSSKAIAKPSLDQIYDVPRSTMERAVSFENTNKQSAHPLVAGPKPRSNTYMGGGQVIPKSVSLPRGPYTPSMLQQYASDSSRETTPLSPHAQSDSGAGSQVQSTHRNPQSSGHNQNGFGRGQSFNTTQPLPVGAYPNRAGDSIPNSPTYFTYNHPHRNDTTPSPETQFLNQSFTQHLNSLQPPKGPRTTHVMDWMQQSSNYWSPNKSVPMVKDPHAKAPQASMNWPPPAGTNREQRVPRKPAVVPHQPVQTRPQRPPQQYSRQIPGVPTRPLRTQPRPPLSASNASLNRNPHAPLGPTRSNPNYLPAASVGDDYFVLDV